MECGAGGNFIPIQRDEASHQKVRRCDKLSYHDLPKFDFRDFNIDKKMRDYIAKPPKEVDPFDRFFFASLSQFFPISFGSLRSRFPKANLLIGKKLFLK